MSRQMTSSAFHKSKTLDNKYMLGDEIGKGAYGRVYKGLDLQNGDFVAIKQVSLENILQDGLNNIMQEIDLLKNLNHKNIVKYLGSLKTKSHLHIILEYVENGSLANNIKPNKFGPFPESLVAVYISQVLEGLVYLHEQGVIHRDIKGANILTTKEGLVKLADFGVATKLNEADVNTHSVVGTPYWMAPEVIEMSGVCAASDIWGVGCTVIELLTCVPPYYDLQPMPALYRIVQDEHPPLPDSISPSLNDFLRQCFKQDARHRPDAKTLLSHPWIQNSRRALQTSLRHSGTLSCRNIEDAEPGDGKVISGEQRDYVKNSDLEKEGNTEMSPSEASLTDDSSKNGISGAAFSGERDNNTEKDTVSDEVLTSDTNSRKLEIKLDSNSVENITSNQDRQINVLENDRNEPVKNMESDPATKNGKTANSRSSELGTSKFTPNSTPPKGTNASTGAGNELNRFSDPPGDATLDDLFQTSEKQEDRIAEAATSALTSHENHDNAVPKSGKNDLAMKLRAAIAQKQMENESAAQSNGGDLYSLMMGVLKEDATDVDPLGLEDKLPAENLFPLQAVEFSKLVSSLRPDEAEDVIISACQKLTTLFQQRPEQKVVFVTQHGFLPLMELLEFQQTNVQVSCAVLQLLNEIIKDNTGFQENACLLGLIPGVMSFAVPDQPWEVRMEAAYFFRQLCLSSSSTLQMFISCRGIPILVGFLMADYAKYREMVHIAIDCMCQVVKLQKATSRNDFCRIAAKNGILHRLTNTLHSLNEANRLASFAAAGFPADGLVPRPRSGSLDLVSPSLVHPNDRSSQASFANLEALGGSRMLGISSSISRGVAYVASRLSTDTTPKSPEFAPNQLENVRPLLSLLDKEPPSRRLSGQLEYVRHFTGIDRQESVLPLLPASGDKKANGLDFLMAEFAEVSERGRENLQQDSLLTSSSKPAAKKILGPETSNVGISSSGASKKVSGVLSGSGVLNARHASATSSGVLAHMGFPWNTDITREYLEKVADLLLEFSSADSVVKSYMCGQSLLSRLFQMFNKIEPQTLLKLLKCINHLSTDPHCLEHLQRAGAIKYLIPNLDLKEGPLVSQIHHEVLSALFNLCKINKRRQEQSAENGIIPHLMNFIMTDSPLKQYALPLLFDMAHASRNSRDQLRAHGGLDVYLSLLEDEAWSVTALDSLAVCLAHDSEKKVEQVLLKKDSVHKLVKFFECCPDQLFLHILEPFLKIITKSSRINTTLAVNGLTPLLISRLDHQDAIARLNLLKLIKAVYEHHPRPKQLIVENDLPRRLQDLIEERRDGQSFGGQVLVKQMATSLLKALHINTVL